MNTRRNNKLDHHVIFCTSTGGTTTESGRMAEWGTAEFIVDNLRQAGDFRILMGYNLMLRGPGSFGSLEIDLVVINRYGVFLLEVKDWWGSIEAYDDKWIVDGRIRPNPLTSIQQKAKVFHSTFFGARGDLESLRRVSVVGLGVLYRGRNRFYNHGNPDADRGILELSSLIRPLSSSSFLHFGNSSRQLTDIEIERIARVVHRSYTPRQEELVGNYRILGELSPGDLFDAYEAQSINMPERRVRLKRYQLPSLTQRVEKNILNFKKNAQALSELGFQPSIVGTLDFFPDTNRPDVFYEVTELVDGRRLDDIMIEYKTSLSLEEQITFIKALCTPLLLAHNHKKNGESKPIYHRNLGPETVYVTNSGAVKLADFDFAKVTGAETITIPGETLIDTKFTAPELLFSPSSASGVSDIYSLGALWYCLAKLPEHPNNINQDQVDQLNLPVAAKELMKRMLLKPPGSRPQTVEEVLKLLENLT